MMASGEEKPYILFAEEQLESLIATITSLEIEPNYIGGYVHRFLGCASWLDMNEQQAEYTPTSPDASSPHQSQECLNRLKSLELTLFNGLLDEVFDPLKFSPLEPSRVHHDNEQSTPRGIYVFSGVRYWLALQIGRYHRALARHGSPQEVIIKFKKSCERYEAWRTSHLQLQNSFLMSDHEHETITAIEDSPPQSQQAFQERVGFATAVGDVEDWNSDQASTYSSSESWPPQACICLEHIPQLFLLFQIIGEHVGFALKKAPETVDHFRGHGLQSNERRALWEAGGGLSLDWGTNYMMEGYLITDLSGCPSDEAFLSSLSLAKVSMMQLYINNLLLTSTSRNQAVFDHTTCTSTACYRRCRREGRTGRRGPRHVEDCNDEKCADVAVSVLDVSRAITNNTQPLIRIRLDPSSAIRTEVIQRNWGSKMEYVAITHVWSDGRGNSEDNALPACQWRHLHSISEQSGGLPIWMDTVCIPVHELERPAPLRTRAIQSMNRIYIEASRVVLLSNDLLRVLLREIFWPDLWVFFRTSAWNRRLWTLQEGAFGGERIFMHFKDRLVKFPEFAFPCQLFRICSPVWENIGDTESVLHSIRLHSQRGKTGALIPMLLHQFKWRNTRWEVDESVIMAGLLGLDTAPIAKIDWRESGAVDRRLELLYERLHDFPTAVLFSQVARMTAPGLGWAPRMLNIMDFDDYTPDPGIASQRTGLITGQGLRFWGHVIFIDNVSTWPDVFNVRLDDSRCREKGYPPIVLQINTLELRPYRKRNSAEENPQKTDPLRTIFRQDQHQQQNSENPEGFAIILQAFERSVAKRPKFKTSGAIVSVIGGGRTSYIPGCCPPGNKGLYRRVLEFISPIHMRLACKYGQPVRVHKIQPGNAYVVEDYQHPLLQQRVSNDLEFPSNSAAPKPSPGLLGSDDETRSNSTMQLHSTYGRNESADDRAPLLRRRHGKGRVVEGLSEANDVAAASGVDTHRISESNMAIEDADLIQIYDGYYSDNRCHVIVG
jgi:hypothetical protein